MLISLPGICGLCHLQIPPNALKLKFTSWSVVDRAGGVVALVYPNAEPVGDSAVVQASCALVPSERVIPAVESRANTIYIGLEVVGAWPPMKISWMTIR